MKTLTGPRLLLLAFVILPVLTLIDAHTVCALGHFGIPGTTDGCAVCHDFISGSYDNPALDNLRWVRSTIEWPPGTLLAPVKFTQWSSALPADGTLADGDDSELDGPCEVCHPATVTYHNTIGDGTSHFDGQNCTACHPHFADDIINYFEPRFVGSQSHITHWTDPRGPQLGEDNCTACHLSTDFSLFADGYPLAETEVCNPCHSPDGQYEGIDDPAVGSKQNWEKGVYNYKNGGNKLRKRKKDWCATCHDDGTCAVNGVSAPNVMGDNTTYGYSTSGHGQYAVLCEDCHDLTVLHTDGRPRTYKATSSKPDRSYRNGYRLNKNMSIPRNGESHPEAFRLCTSCHIYTDITGPESNFRDEQKGFQFHRTHLEWWPYFLNTDSDFDGVGCSSGNCIDSAMTCVNCHQVHGSPTGPMIRHGELMSTSGTSDKVPALDFQWYMADGSTPTTMREQSRYGSMVCGVFTEAFADVSVNHVCAGCHETGELRWYRTPTDAAKVKVSDVWTSDLNDTPKSVFSVDEDIRYHVSFSTTGKYSYLIKSPKSKSRATNTTGADWKTILPKTDTLSAGTHEWTWDESIPSAAIPFSEAEVTILVRMLDGAGGALLDKGKKTATFRVFPQEEPGTQ